MPALSRCGAVVNTEMSDLLESFLGKDSYTMKGVLGYTRMSSMCRGLGRVITKLCISVIYIDYITHRDFMAFDYIN